MDCGRFHLSFYVSPSSWFQLYLEERGTSIIFKGTVVWSEKDLVQVHCFTVLALICWPVVCQQTL